MRILVPYVSMHPKAMDALPHYDPRLRFAYTGRQPTDYWHAVRKYWTGERDLVIIEQDNEIHPEVLPSFESCPKLWCSFWYKGPLYGMDATNWVFGDGNTFYPNLQRMVTGIGCVKFSAELQRRIPASTIAHDDQGWDTLDEQISSRLLNAAYSPHIHGEVKHHHEYEIIYLDPPGVEPRRYIWDHRNKGEYPTETKYRIPVDIPDDAERVIVNHAENEAR